MADARLQTIRDLPDVRYASFGLERAEASLELSGQVGVEFVEGVDVQQVMKIAEIFDLGIGRAPVDGWGDHWRFWLPGDADPLSVAAALHEHDLVDWADLERAGGLRLDSPSDPLFQYQYYLDNSRMYNGVPVDIAVQQAWDSTVVGDGVKVAVLDNGVQYDHEDLGLLVSAGWDAVPYAPDTIGYKPQVCDSFCATVPEPQDDHGTNVAGIILGQHDNSVGIAGIAPYAQIFPIRIVRSTGPTGASNLETAEAIQIAWNAEGADVVTGSFHTEPSSAIADAISDANDYGRGGLGTVLVFSAGTGLAEVGFPASLSTTIAVGAIDKNGYHASYSPTSSNGELDIVAPSSPNVGHCSGDLETTDLEGTDGCNGAPNNDDNYTGRFGGTSAAAPQVAAAAALMISEYSSMPGYQVQLRLQDFADPWGSTAEYGNGKLNISRAIFPGEPPAATVSGPGRAYENETCTWVVSSSGAPVADYRWYRDGSWQVLEDDSVYTASVGTSDFELVAQVYDQWGRFGSDTVDVDVTASTWDQCVQ